MLSLVATAASRALYVPITFTRIVRTGFGDDGVDARDAGGVDDVRAAGHELGEPSEVEHVPLDELEVRVRFEVRPREGVAMEVVDGDHLVRVDEPSRERRADEPGAARDEDALARQ